MCKRSFLPGKMMLLIAGTVMSITVLNGCRKASAAKTVLGGDEAFHFASAGDVKFPLKEKLELTVFVYATATGGGTYQDNYVTDWIEKKTNIHLNYVYDLDGDDAKTKLNLVMTDAADLPDIFLATHWTKSEVQSYGQQGLLVPLNSYLKDARNWNELNKKSPARKADLTMTDGNIYTYGADNECYHSMFQNRMWIYMPWVNKLNGGKIPQTTEELYTYLKKVKTQDPNGNGKADEIPMTGFIGGWSTDPTVWITNAFIECNNPLSNTNPTIAAGLVVNNGKIEYAVMKKKYKEALKYIHRLYKEGLLDNQTFTQDNTQFTALLDSDVHLVAVHPGGAVNADGKHFWSKQPGKWQDWAAFAPVAGPDGVRLAARNITSYFGSCVGSVSSNCKYPEIAVALFDFLASEEATNVQIYGPEGYGWNWTDKGTALSGGSPRYEDHTISADFDWIGNGFPKKYANYAYVSDAMIQCSTMDFRAALKIDKPDYDVEYILQKAAEKYAKYAPDVNTLVPNLAFAGDDRQAVSEYTLTIGGYVNQAAVQFITGDMDIDKDWDNYIGKLQNMGVDDYIARYQKAYNTYSTAAGK